jgi:phenylalanyl-tRNA synthetase alpha subunit
MALKMSSSTKIDWTKELIFEHPENNVSPYIANLVGRDLHLKKDHPLGIIKDKIEAYFKSRDPTFEFLNSLNPIVTKKQCFDDLLIPEGHVSRKPSDTYYLDDKRLLRTHTSAHQTELLKKGSTKFLCTGDVYRRDEVDATHYPALHLLLHVSSFYNYISVLTLVYIYIYMVRWTRRTTPRFIRWRASSFSTSVLTCRLVSSS